MITKNETKMKLKNETKMKLKNEFRLIEAVQIICEGRVTKGRIVWYDKRKLVWRINITNLQATENQIQSILKNIPEVTKCFNDRGNLYLLITKRAKEIRIKLSKIKFILDELGSKPKWVKSQETAVHTKSRPTLKEIQEANRKRRKKEQKKAKKQKIKRIMSQISDIRRITNGINSYSNLYRAEHRIAKLTYQIECEIRNL